MPSTAALPASDSSGTGGRIGSIQALRAGAVMAVVVYHLLPLRLPGGYVGVDIFFVVSGYLMTRTLLHLHEQTAKSGRPMTGTLRAFYLRRAARLLPSGLLTLALTAGILLASGNTLMWWSNFREILASAAFVENWVLAAGATDYLAGTGLSAVTHYWSLSVEEQFYAVWPLILLGALGLARRWGRLALPMVVGGVTAISLAASVTLTSAAGAAGYLNTGLRFWELSLGGVCFLCQRPLLQRVRWVVPWVLLSLSAMALSLLAFNGATVFPGSAALVPTGGTAIVLVFGEAVTWRPLRALVDWTPVQWIGDHSYSIYLLHFPALVLLGTVVRLTGPSLYAAVLLVTFGGAVLMKRHVEDRFRVTGPPQRGGATPHRRSSTVRAPLTAIVVTAGLVVATAGSGLVWISGRRAEAVRALDQAAGAIDTDCAALVAAGPKGAGVCWADGPVPAPLAAVEDWPFADCQQSAERDQVLSCSVGAGRRTAVAVGDSHMTQWLPAVQVWARANDYTVRTFLKGDCALTREAGTTASCAVWNASVQRRIAALRPEVTFTAARSALGAAGVAVRAEGLAAAWRDIASHSGAVVAIDDIPQPSLAGISDVPSCLERHDNDASSCAFDEISALEGDAIPAAVRLAPGLKQVGFADTVCADDRCVSQAHGLLIYLDGAHVTGSFAAALGPEFAKRVQAALR